MEIQAEESVVISLPSSPRYRSERSSEATGTSKQWWSTATYPVRQLWLLVKPRVIRKIDFYTPYGTSELSPLFWIKFVPIYLASRYLDGVSIILSPIVNFTWRVLKRELTWLSEYCSILSWEKKFVTSCIAVSLDPFFFYIPIIDEENKCLGVDIKLRNTLLVLRSLTDFASLLHIVTEVRDRNVDQILDSHTDTESYFDFEPRPILNLFQKLKSKIEAIPWISVPLVIDFLALLPVPQVAIIVVFFKMGDSKFIFKRTILNVFLIFQYVPRVCQIYLSSTKIERIGVWGKGVFNFFFYILAGHVLASFWYFFSIQRETSCWHQACRNAIGCISTYECGGNTTKNVSLLNELCPINSSNATLFDFGIYLDLLQSGNTGSVEFSRKFFYSLWWGMKNLRVCYQTLPYTVLTGLMNFCCNFGTNLETSNYVWENCFAILIGLIGLLLFLYLIGNVQTYIQLATTKSVKIAEKNEELRRTRVTKKYLEMKMWMSDRDLSEDTKTKIRAGIKQTKLAEKFIDQPVDLNLICSAGFDALNSLKSCIAMKVLKKVPLFEGVDESSLKHITGYMEPVIYTENSYILRAGGPCTMLLFIVEGVIELTDRTSSNGAETMTKRLQKGDYYGDGVLDLASLNLKLGAGVWEKSNSNQDVKCLTKVEAFLTNFRMLDNFLRDCSIRLNDNVKPTVPPNNTDETSNEINTRSKTMRPEEIEESKQMEMKTVKLDQGRGQPREDVAITGASTSSTTVEQMLSEQLVLVRQIRDDMATQGRRLDGMAAFLSTWGYPGGIPAPPTP